MMKYAALLRGINVGTANRIDMKSLKNLFERLEYVNVSTYINSGNVFFESHKPVLNLSKEIESALNEEFGLNIPTLVKSVSELQKIASVIPAEWLNDELQRTDVAYLFREIDYADIIGELPLKLEYMDVRYTGGALFWNVKREDYNRSRLNKLIGHKLYRYMTLRNVNTARYLAGM